MFLAAFTADQGYSADADYSARAWLMHQTGITRGAAASHTAWARQAAAHPAVVAALAAQMYERARADLPDQDPERDFGSYGISQSSFP